MRSLIVVGGGGVNDNAATAEAVETQFKLQRLLAFVSYESLSSPNGNQQKTQCQQSFLGVIVLYYIRRIFFFLLFFFTLWFYFPFFCFRRLVLYRQTIFFFFLKHRVLTMLRRDRCFRIDIMSDVQTRTLSLLFILRVRLSVHLSRPLKYRRQRRSGRHVQSTFRRSV